MTCACVLRMIQYSPRLCFGQYCILRHKHRSILGAFSYRSLIGEAEGYVLSELEHKHRYRRWFLVCHHARRFIYTPPCIKMPTYTCT